MDPEQHIRVLLATSVEDISFGEELLFESEGDLRPSRFVFAQLPTGQFVIAGRENGVVGELFEYVVLGDDTRIVAFQVRPVTYVVLRTVKWKTGESWYYAQFVTDADFFSCISCFSAVSDRQEAQEDRATQEVVRLEGSLAQTLGGPTNTTPRDYGNHDGKQTLDEVHDGSDGRNTSDCSDQILFPYLGPVLFGAAIGIMLGCLMGKK
ncbi:uncharacterized protein B0H18DRAFT_952516 [Fomitopsis serialis]|uniref:uncharacterized protein n=1 Tax=Fomitopsis serialis TaxID=139415 RepID=UPI00200742AE|nr:uncharacterized protein B0H18DRAFT_952516 [Neoantrodia serialis]KAH9931835.1 hypothetical protein B0H18DRAFT_952516 [Neoantrodia serialis]